MEPIVLSAFGAEPIDLVDPDEGKTWKLVPNLRGIEALRMLRAPHLASEALVDRHTLEWFAEILSRALRRHHPEMTMEAVLEEFAAVHIIEAVTGFLTRLGQSAAGGSGQVQRATAAAMAGMPQAPATSTAPTTTSQQESSSP